MRTSKTATVAVAAIAVTAFGLTGMATAATAASGAAPASVSAARPQPPAVVSAISGDKMITVQWRPPASTVDAVPAPKIRYDVLQDGVGVIESRTAGLAYTVKNLAPNTKYTFTVQVYLNGKKSGKKSVTAITKPGMLINPRAIGNNMLAWDAPVEAVEPLTYNIYKGSTLYAANVTSTQLAITPPDPGKSAAYIVTAVNAAGEGPKASITVTTPKA